VKWILVLALSCGIVRRKGSFGGKDRSVCEGNKGGSVLFFSLRDHGLACAGSSLCCSQAVLLMVAVADVIMY
jgi:hypothetical protein